MDKNVITIDLKSVPILSVGPERFMITKEELFLFFYTAWENGQIQKQIVEEDIQQFFESFLNYRIVCSESEIARVSGV